SSPTRSWSRTPSVPLRRSPTEPFGRSEKEGSMRRHGYLRIFAATAFLAALGARPARANIYYCGGGDVACLINSINMANAMGGWNLINLGAGTYNLTSVNNVVQGREGPNGLPIILSQIVLQGTGASSTVIQRAPGAPEFRIFDVWGFLTLSSLAIQG